MVKISFSIQADWKKGCACSFAKVCKEKTQMESDREREKREKWG